MTRPSLRDAILEECPAERERIVEDVPAETEVTETAVADTLDYLERTGVVYVVGEEVRETRGGA